MWFSACCAAQKQGSFVQTISEEEEEDFGDDDEQQQVLQDESTDSKSEFKVAGKVKCNKKPIKSTAFVTFAKVKSRADEEFEIDNPHYETEVAVFFDKI